MAGNYFEYVAMAIGSRSQTSRTYLEKEFESHGFTGQSLEELIKHALRALAASLSGKSIAIHIDKYTRCTNATPLTLHTSSFFECITLYKLSGDTELDSKSASIAIVGKDTPFQVRN